MKKRVVSFLMTMMIVLQLFPLNAIAATGTPGTVSGYINEAYMTVTAGIPTLYAEVGNDAKLQDANKIEFLVLTQTDYTDVFNDEISGNDLAGFSVELAGMTDYSSGTQNWGELKVQSGDLKKIVGTKILQNGATYKIFVWCSAGTADPVAHYARTDITLDASGNGVADTWGDPPDNRTAIAGAVTTSGTDDGFVGSVLSANLTGITEGSTTASDYDFAWSNGTTTVGTSETYTITADDVKAGSTITLTITVKAASTTHKGSLTASGIAATKKTPLATDFAAAAATYTAAAQNPTITSTVSGIGAATATSAGKTDAGIYTDVVFDVVATDTHAAASGLILGTWEIKKADLVSVTITAPTDTDVYSGTTRPAVTASGAVGVGTDSAVTGTIAWTTGDANTTITAAGNQNWTFTPTSAFAANYNAKTGDIAFTIKGAETTEIEAITGATFDDSEHSFPTPVVKTTGGTTIANTEYSVSWSNSSTKYTDAGTYICTVTMNNTGRYANPTPVNFVVAQLKIATAPTLNATTSKTATQIVLTAPTSAPTGAGAAEYSKDNGTTWQDSATFTGLTADTEYTFVARWKADASGNYLPSDKSAEYKVTTEATPTYTFSLDKKIDTFATNSKYGYTQPVAETITITNTGNQALTNVAVAKTDADSAFTMGALSTTTIALGGTATFTVQPNASLAAKTDAYTATFVVSADSGTTTGADATFTATFEVGKAKLGTPTAPTVNGATTSTQITLNAITAQGGTIEYTCVEAPSNVSGKTTGVFTNLTPGTEYTFTAKAVADNSGNYEDSDASAASAKIKTQDAPTYTFTLDKSVDTFATNSKYGYTQPTAETITITNTGNQALTNVAVAKTDADSAFTMGALSTTTIALGGTATFTVQPNASLAAKTDAYTATFVVSADSGTTTGADATFTATFEVGKTQLTWTQGTVEATKKYDGTGDNASLTAGKTADVAGEKNGETVTATVGADKKVSLSGTTVAIPGTFTMTASDFTFECTGGTGTPSMANYELPADLTTATGAITAASITGAGAITGTVAVGQELTIGVVTADNGLTPAITTDYTVQWYRADDAGGTNEASITSATAASYTLVNADIGKFIYAKVTGTGNYKDTALTAKTTAVPKITIATNPVVTITTDNGVTGTAEAGDVLTVAHALLANCDIQWKRGAENIGSNQATYTIVADDMDKEITAVITAKTSDPIYTGTLTSNSITPGKIVVTAIGAITGNLKFGKTLTAGALTPTGATVNYQWYRSDTATNSGGTAIGTDANTYELTQADIGKYIYVVATGNGVYSGNPASAATAIIAKADAPVAPANVSKVDVAADDDTTGKLENVDATMEYSTSSTFASDVHAITGTTVTGLAAGTYYVRVKETATTKAGAASGVLVIAPAVPNKVTGLAASGDGQLVITWSQPKMNGGTFSKYIVDIQTGGASVATYPKDITAGVDTLTETVTGLTNGTAYTITVQAVNNVGTGAVSDTLTATPASSGGGVIPSSGVTFNAGPNGKLLDKDGKEVSSVKVDLKDKLPEYVPEVKASENYKFMGWSTDNGKTFVDPAKVEVSASASYTAIFAKYDHMPYIVGRTASSFAPDGQMTRAEATTILARLSSGFSEDGAYAKSDFTDVEAGAWYAKYVNFAAENDMVSGYEDGSFRPDRSISRAEFMSMIARYLKLDTEGKKTEFADCNGHWAEGAIAALVKMGAVAGYPDGSFKPDQTITRAEAVRTTNAAIGRTPDKATAAERFDGYVDPFTDVSSDAWYFYDVMEAALRHVSDDFHSGK